MDEAERHSVRIDVAGLASRAAIARGLEEEAAPVAVLQATTRCPRPSPPRRRAVIALGFGMKATW